MCNTYYDCWIILQTALKIADSNLYCKIRLVWLDSSPSAYTINKWPCFSVSNLSISLISVSFPFCYMHDILNTYDLVRSQFSMSGMLMTQWSFVRQFVSQTGTLTLTIGPGVVSDSSQFSILWNAHLICQCYRGVCDQNRIYAWQVNLTCASSSVKDSLYFISGSLFILIWLILHRTGVTLSDPSPLFLFGVTHFYSVWCICLNGSSWLIMSSPKCQSHTITSGRPLC